MPHLSARITAAAAALGWTFLSAVDAHAAPPPGTKCEGGSAVFDTNGRCVRNGSTCFATDGTLIGWTNGDTGRCVPYSLSQSY
jgi:hypothetical protein